MASGSEQSRTQELKKRTLYSGPYLLAQSAKTHTPLGLRQADKRTTQPAAQHGSVAGLPGYIRHAAWAGRHGWAAGWVGRVHAKSGECRCITSCHHRLTPGMRLLCFLTRKCLRCGLQAVTGNSSSRTSGQEFQPGVTRDQPCQH